MRYMPLSTLFIFLVFASALAQSPRGESPATAAGSRDNPAEWWWIILRRRGLPAVDDGGEAGRIDPLRAARPYGAVSEKGPGSLRGLLVSGKFAKPWLVVHPT